MYKKVEGSLGPHIEGFVALGLQNTIRSVLGVYAKDKVSEYVFHLFGKWPFGLPSRNFGAEEACTHVMLWTLTF